MLRGYLCQTAVYSPRTGTDDRGQSIYGPQETIRCRRQSRTQRTLTATGESIQANTVYYLVREVREGDMLDGKTVAAIEPWVQLDGEAVGYKAVS